MKSLSLFLLLSLFSSVSAKPEPRRSRKLIPVRHIAQKACRGDLYEAHALTDKGEDAGTIHIRSALQLILFADTENAGLFHEIAKDLSRTEMPPLAKLHLDGESCNGLSDIFYIAAVTIKKLIDKQFGDPELLTAHLTMLTLLSDSGFQTEAEKHLKEALLLQPNDSSLKMRSVLMTPGVYDSFDHLRETRDLLEKRLANISQESTFSIKTLNELSLSPIFYFVYQGYNDAPFMRSLQEVYSSAHPTLVSYKIDRRPSSLLDTPVDRRSALDSSNEDSDDIPKIRIGFVSSHFRRHSICKLFCNVISGLANHTHRTPSGELLGFEVYIFSGQDQSKEDGYTTQLKQNVKEFVRIKKFTIPSRREVTNRFIDVLVYLDIGMDPSTSVWGASKLAPIQACLWGHPTTTGMGSMDYFISADGYHAGRIGRSLESQGESLIETYENTNWYEETERSFTEQLVRLPSAALGFAFNKPTLELQNLDTMIKSSPSPEDLVTTPEGLLNSISLLMLNSTLPNATDSIHSLESVVQLKSHSGSKLVLIPQHLPKFHPGMDSLLSRILSTIPDSYIVITYEMKRTMWRRTLEKRWLSIGISQEMINTRFLWLTQLSPQQYLGLLALGDVMLDPFPFGGGVTSLEAFSMCTPVLTLPKKQTVPALTAGMIRAMFPNNEELLEEFIFTDEDNLFNQIQTLLTDPQKRFSLRQSICDHNDRLYSGSVETIIIRLCEKFFELVEKDDESWFKNIYSECSMNRDELVQCYYEYINQRLGGRPYFSDRRGHPNLVSFHAQVGITAKCQYKWLSIMEDAIDTLDDVIGSDLKAILMTFFTHLCATYQTATRVMESHEMAPLYDDDFPVNRPMDPPPEKEAVISSSDAVSRHEGHRK